jgi:hypothetical protein
VVVLWLGCRCCRSSVNTICGRIMIGLSLFSVSKHNMWSYYDWVYCCCRCLLAEDNDNPIKIGPHIVFTDKRQQRQPNHNTTTYYVYWWTTTNTICCRILIVLLLSSVSKDNMWLYYDWVYCFPSVNTICGRVMIGLSFSAVSKHNMWLYYDWIVVVFRRMTEENNTTIKIRQHIVFTDGRQ